MPKNHLDIILPCYNPALGWQENLLHSYSRINNMLSETEINLILVNDGSKFNVSNDEIEFLEESISNFTFIELKNNLGKGASLREGFKQSNSEYAVFTDVDFPYLEENLVEMFSKVQSGADIVIGTRNKDYYKKVPLFRKLISKFFKTIIKISFQVPTSDTQAGLKAFSKKGKEAVLQTTIDRYLFDLELVKRANKQKLKFAFVNLDLKENIILSKMPVSILLSEIKNLFRILFI